jgi:hypothetical protein
MKNETILPIIFAVVLSIGIAFSAYFLLIHFTVDNDVYNARVNNLLNFYDQRHDGDVFILGSSFVNEGIDAFIVEDSLNKRNINRSVYILGVNADNPLNRVSELDNLIASRPKTVIIGLSYPDLMNNTNINEERLVLSFQRKQIDQRKQIQEEFQPVFNDDQIKLMSQTPFERFLDKRKYLIPSIVPLFQRGLSNGERNGDVSVTNFKDPWTIKIDKTEAEKIDIIKSSTKNYSENETPIFEDFNLQKKALLYTIHRLQKNNISVLIINMPINPLMSGVINESSRHNLSNFLNSTGVPWYDYEQEYPSEYFIDTTHMNVGGRTDFSPKVAKIIADNLIHGA